MGTEKDQKDHSDQWMNLMSLRSVAGDAGYIAKMVEPGMSILDVGCGSGTITVGLGELAHDGKVVGLDRSEKRFEVARSLAMEAGVDNVTFQAGDAYELPFDDESFDIVHENAMLMHMANPDRVIGEMNRVLKPGGYIALRDLYISGAAYYGSVACPIEGGQPRVNAAIVESQRNSDSDWDVGIRLRGHLNAAGFAKVETGSSPRVFASDECWDFVWQNAGNAFDRGLDQAVELGLLAVEDVTEYRSWRTDLQSDPAAVAIVMWLHTTGQKL